MSLRKEFLQLMKTKPIPPYATLPSSGIDVEWSELMNGWKIDMGMDVQEFFQKNPDIFNKIQERLPDLDLKNVSTRDILKRGVAEEILNQLIIETDIPGEADRIFKGQRLRSVATGTLTAEARNKIYERAFDRGQLPQGTSINPEGGVRHTSTTDTLTDLSQYQRTGRLAQGQRYARDVAEEMGLDSYTYKGKNIWKTYNGWLQGETIDDALENVRASQRRGGSREVSQKLKEEVYQQSKDGYEPLTTAEQERVQVIKDNANAKGMDADHQYSKAAYDEGKVNHPEFRKELDPEINRYVKPPQERQLSQYMLSQELHNPSKSMDLTETLDLASNKKKWYGDVIHNFAENRALFGNIDVSKLSSADSTLQVGAGLATGDIGAVIGGSAGLTLQNPAVQKLIMKRFAKSGAKIAPGVGLTLSALEAKGYASQGRWTQAGVAALSGIVGEVPVVGDAGSAVLDFGNTVTDILTGNFGNVAPDEDPNIRRNIDGFNYKRPRF